MHCAHGLVSREKVPRDVRGGCQGRGTLVTHQAREKGCFPSREHPEEKYVQS